jgi:GNAT superfamily N-acetyltransferase
MELTAFGREHARQVAEIHAEGQAETFLTRLGLDFLTALYKSMALSDRCFGSVLLDGPTVGGVGVVALDTDELFAEIKRRHWHRLAPPVIRQVFRHPSLVGAILENMRYPVKLSAPPGEAEILFMGLRRAYMRQGEGPRLLLHLLDEAYRRGCPSATATVDRRNRAIRWMVATLPGVYVDHEIKLNGQTMLVYRAALPLNGKGVEIADRSTASPYGRHCRPPHPGRG